MIMVSILKLYPMKYGMINVVDDFTNPRIVTEEERLKKTLIL